MVESILKIESQPGRNTIQATSVHREQSPWPDVTERIAADGDRQAFAVFYDAFFETMFTTVRRTSGRDEATCLDIVQEAMLKAIRCMKRLDSHSHVAAWSTAVAKSATYDWLRQQVRRNRAEAALAGEVESPDQVVELERAADDETARLIWIQEQLCELPGELRTMILLKYRMGWTLKKIGRRFGLKTGAVDGRIRRAVSELRTKALEDLR